MHFLHRQHIQGSNLRPIHCDAHSFLLFKSIFSPIWDSLSKVLGILLTFCKWLFTFCICSHFVYVHLFYVFIFLPGEGNALDPRAHFWEHGKQAVHPGNDTLLLYSYFFDIICIYFTLVMIVYCCFLTSSILFVSISFW